MNGLAEHRRAVLLETLKKLSMFTSERLVRGFLKKCSDALIESVNQRDYLDTIAPVIGWYYDKYKKDPFR